MQTIESFGAEAYSVSKMHQQSVCTNSPSVVGPSVVSLKVLKLDPIFWVFTINSASKYGSCLVVNGRTLNQNKNNVKTASLVAMDL